MQLVSLSLYSAVGERETINFETGALNVITGESKTGKSVLVKLIDYCLGRSDVPTSAGKVENALTWVGAVWQFDDGGRAFVGRPLPQGARKNEQSMLVLGDSTLEPPPFAALSVTHSCQLMRQVVGGRLGITESRVEPRPGSLRRAFRTSLGHAALLCIQGQDEISSANRLFHRQDDSIQAQLLRDTLPYFLGASPADEAVLKAMLRQQQRHLQRLERELQAARERSTGLDDELQALLTEAVGVGLTDTTSAPDREQLVLALHRASRLAAPTGSAGAAHELQDTKRAEEAEIATAEEELDQLLAQRALLLDESEQGGAYAGALEVQQGRLTSLNLLPERAEGADDPPVDAHTCPVCGQSSTAADPTSHDLRVALEALDARLSRVRKASPAKGRALEQANADIAQAQARVHRAYVTRDAGLSADLAVGSDLQRRRDFVRGRISAVLAHTADMDKASLDSLGARIELAELEVQELERHLSDESVRELLQSRLLGVGRRLTEFAQQLELEHSDRAVRIDLSELTVIADVDDKPVPLHRIGSAENWIGYHIASHLALHDSFLRHDRPVPRLLVLDQPSQGHYPSEMVKLAGQSQEDADEAAVTRLYTLMQEFVTEHAGRFQIIVVDHADLAEPWFQESVVSRWRPDPAGGGFRKLVPSHWL
jgi:hypothetical protein